MKTDRLESIKAPVAGELVRFEAFMRGHLRSDSRYVAGILDYIMEGGGKGIRPLVVMLTAGMYGGGCIGERAHLAAMLVEMLHKASLVHDDVIDEAEVRHSQASVNAKWSSRVAVIVGDYILARSFTTGVSSGEYDIVEYITASMADLAEGELIQMENATQGGYGRERYLDIIYRKTALVLAVSAGVGALSTNAPIPEVATAKAIGRAIGMAFQIRDDILDFFPSAQTGKSHCADLREGKITLPLITILERAGDSERRLILERVTSIHEHPDEVEALREFILIRGGIDMAKAVMEEYLDEARRLIMLSPASDYRHSLLHLADYIGEREK